MSNTTIDEIKANLVENLEAMKKYDAEVWNDVEVGHSAADDLLNSSFFMLRELLPELATLIEDISDAYDEVTKYYS